MIVFDKVFSLGTKFLINLKILPQDGRMLTLLIIGLAIFYLVS